MALNSINTNVAAYFAQQNINKANAMTSSSIGRLSSGNRIVRASDDVAAMSVGTSLRTTVSTLKIGLLNASQGTSMLQVADGALGKMQDMLLRQKALATQATSGSLTSAERGFLDQEFQNLTSEIDRLVETTNFNGVNLLGGTLGGASTRLSETDAIAGAMAASTETGLIVSQFAIEAFNIGTTHATAYNAAPAADGQIALVDSAGAVLADDDFLAVNSDLVGKLGELKFSNLVDGVSVSVSMEINGVTYTGQAAHDTNTGSFTLENGNTYIEIGYTTLNLTSAVTTEAARARLNDIHDDITFMKTSQLDGVDFLNTALEGVTFAGASGTVMVRTDSNDPVSITNFKYEGNENAVNTNTISVQVNGETWYSQNVDDTITSADTLTFTNSKQEAIQINLTGMTGTITDIRTDLVDRANLINALNEGFKGLNKGVDFALGTQTSDKLTVNISKADTIALFNGQSLSVSTAEKAVTAGEVLNDAIKLVTAIRADVGAMMSRFDFATANIEIAMQNQDAARGTLLDTDVSAESTAYATAQVQLQAGIAVLAQANQLPQNLLKLIG